MKMFITTLIAVFSLIAFSADAKAQSVGLRTSLRGSRFQAVIVNSSGAACKHVLYGASSQSLLARPLSRFPLVETSSSTAQAQFTVSSLPAIISRTSTYAYFFTESVCGSRTLHSNVSKLRLTTTRSTRGNSLSSWLSRIRFSLLRSRVTLTEAFPNLQFTKPLYFTSAEDFSNKVYVVEQGGLIKSFDNDSAATSSATYLDVTSKIITTGGEQGLLGLAFSPNYQTDGYVFVAYTRAGDGATVVERYSRSINDVTVADPNSGVVVISAAQPFDNHNGGCIQFGSDGYLYLGLGDGGAGGDPLKKGQDRTQLLGKLLRLDVSTLPYTIPSTNPYASSTSGFRPEIYAYGFRNPWRFSFDSANGRLWVGDVGQGDVEEVDIVQPARDYGWSIMEGSQCYPAGSSCNKRGLQLPITEYTHKVGSSITGGYVYRGSEFPSFYGLYFYADFIEGKIFGLDAQGRVSTVLLDSDRLIASFGEDQNGKLYVVAYDTGKILKVAR